MSDDIERENIAQTIARLVPEPIGFTLDTPLIALPEGYGLESLERFEATPRRKTANVAVNDAGSFISYYCRHAAQEKSTIWCDANFVGGKVKFTGLLNDNGLNGATPDWRDHVVSFAPAFSVEWQRWLASSARPMTQIAFAAFIEDNLKDIVSLNGSPTGSQMLDMALSFEANQDMRFRSAIRLQSGGVQMSFSQDDDANTLAKMQMFDRFNIGIPVFWSGEAYQLGARLRYTVKDGKLSIWYEWIRPDRVLEAATKSLIDTIAVATAAPFFYGNPF